jgi:hypothetical protein
MFAIDGTSIGDPCQCWGLLQQLEPTADELRQLIAKARSKLAPDAEELPSLDIREVDLHWLLNVVVSYVVTEIKGLSTPFLRLLYPPGGSARNSDPARETRSAPLRLRVFA